MAPRDGLRSNRRQAASPTSWRGWNGHKRPGLRVLYTSGYTDDTIVRHGVLEAGMAFIQKPFTANVVLQKIRDVLDAR